MHPPLPRKRRHGGHQSPHFPWKAVLFFKELEEIISRLLNPATTTMLALSKQGIKCKDFKPSVRLRARKKRSRINTNFFIQCIKMELVPGDRAYEDDVAIVDMQGTHLQAQGYHLRATRGSPPNQSIKNQSHGATSELYAEARVIAELIAHDEALLHQLELFVQDCVHLHLEIWWRTAELAAIKKIHAADICMLAQTCTAARKAALRVRTKQLRHHWLWLTITKSAEQLAERFAGTCLFNATNHGTCSAKGNLRSQGPFGNVHLDNAYAEQAGWQHGWSLHYNKNLECW